MTPFTDADVATILPLALRSWASVGVPADAVASLRIVIGDLPGTKLADTLGSTITIDADAAGWGWNLTPGVPDTSRIDLLSVLLHEVGHVLGYEHSADGLMASEIDPGTLLRITSQPTVDVVAATPLVAAQVAVTVASSMAVAQHAISHTGPVAGAVEQSARAVDRVARGIARVAAPAVRNVATRLDIRMTQSDGGTTMPSNILLASMMLAGLFALTLLRRRGAVPTLAPQRYHLG